MTHCRANLARQHGQQCADRFLEIWLALTGRREYHPYWDLTTVVSMSAEGPDAKLDDFVAAAAARLGC